MQHVPRTVVLVAGLILTACASQDAPRSVDRPAGGTPAPTYDGERSTNLLAYRERYLAIADDLMSRRRGAWVAIVDGHVLPNVDGEVAPTESLDSLIRTAESAAPHALHRFVFRVGEDGDVDWPMGGCELKHVVGTPFLGMLERDDVEMRGIAPGQPIKVLFGETFQAITVAGSDARMYVRPVFGPPGAAGTASADYCVSTGFGGVAVLPAADYPEAGLWEIPGTADVFGGAESGLCSRAIARMQWPGSNLDLVVAVALWPKAAQE